MEKNYEDFCGEVQFLKNLKPEERKQEFNNLSERTLALDTEIVSNSKAILETEKKLKDAETKTEVIKREYSETRQKRQSAIALDKDPEKFSTSISALLDKQDLLEDTIIGLRQRVEDLKTEGDLLAQERTEVAKRLLRIEEIPLVAEYNDCVQKAAEAQKKLIRLAEKLGEGFSRFSSGPRTVILSDFDAFEVLPKLYLLGDKELNETTGTGRLKNTFALREFDYVLREEREKAVVA